MSSVDPSHQGIPTYKQEFAKGVELFKNSLIEYTKTTEEPKKAQFKKVMENALQIMNQSAKAALGQNVQSKQHQLETDYQAYMAHQSKPLEQKLFNDLSDLQNLS